MIRTYPQEKTCPLCRKIMKITMDRTTVLGTGTVNYTCNECKKTFKGYCIYGMVGTIKEIPFSK